MDRSWADDQTLSDDNQDWLREIERIFIPSKQCKQCHDRHFEEWKGMRERTEDLKSFGRVDGALLHGNALKSPVFKTVLGLWLSTNPTNEQKTQCLACHVPAVTVFPEHTDRIIEQVISGSSHVKVEGIGCTSCHLISAIEDTKDSYPAFNLSAGRTMFGPYPEAEENLVHPSKQADIYEGAHYCTTCHFDKVKDVAQAHLGDGTLSGLVCQDCHMEQSTGSSTNERGRLSRPIGRHWFLGVVTPDIMLSNRNIQAEWSSRVDIEAQKIANSVTGTVHILNGNLTHMFPGGDPTLKQFFVKLTLKDETGKVIGHDLKKYGRSYAELMTGQTPQPLISGGTTRHIPFSIPVKEGHSPSFIEASISYALIPEPGATLKNRFLASLSEEKDRKKAEEIITEYTSRRLLTFRTKALETSDQQSKES